MDRFTSANQVLPHRAVGAEQTIPAGDALLEATLTVPLGARGIVALLHAKSAGRFDPGNRFSGEVFEQSGLATLQVDLLTPAEDAAFSAVNQTAGEGSLLVTRVLAVVDWLTEQAETTALGLGLFASSTEAGAALFAAERAPRVSAVVSRGAYPPLASDAPTRRAAPTLFIDNLPQLARAEELAAEFFCQHLARD